MIDVETVKSYENKHYPIGQAIERPFFHEGLLNFLDLRAAIQEGIDSGQGISSEDIFAELAARYAEI